MIKLLKSSLLVLPLFFFSNLSIVYAEDFQCEVMSLEGSAYVTNSSASHQPLKEGDMLSVKDIVEVGSGSTVDLAYDKDWQNVTRLEENSKVEIRSIYPTNLQLAYGGVFAKLKSLPKESTFTVETPTAIAAVRGTEYRTVSSEDDGTQVYNFSDSQVYVFGQDESGQMSETPMIVENAQFTEIRRPGALPMASRKMSDNEFQRGGQFRERIEKRIQENVARGRFAKVPDMRAIEKMHHERMEAGRAGRGALTSLEPGQEMNARLKELMNRENRILQKMDNAQKSSGGRIQGDKQNGPRSPRGQDGVSGPKDQKLGENAVNRPDDLKKNDQGSPQGQSDGNGQPANKKPQPKRGSTPPPARPPR